MPTKRTSVQRRKSAKKSAQRRKSAKKSVQRRKSAKKSVKKTPGTPATLAYTLPLYTRRKGRNGFMYMVTERSDGTHSWRKCGNKLCYSKNTKDFVGPRFPTGAVSDDGSSQEGGYYRRKSCVKGKKNSCRKSKINLRHNHGSCQKNRTTSRCRKI